MDNYMVYTPEAHIAITEVYAENGVVFLKFKKPKSQIYEVMTLDMFLSLVYNLLSLLMRREADSEGKLHIRWGEQNIA